VGEERRKKKVGKDKMERGWVDLRYPF